MLFTDGMLQRLVEPFMFSQANWRILALVLMTALPFAALGADEDARAKQLDAILAKAVTSGQPGLAVLQKKKRAHHSRRGTDIRAKKHPRPIRHTRNIYLVLVQNKATTSH